jgi:hypothetical protein
MSFLILARHGESLSQTLPDEAIVLKDECNYLTQGNRIKIL